MKTITYTLALLILLACAAGVRAIDDSANPRVNKGAEDDADDCCGKCAEDEACSTTPTGCECWKPGSVQALSMASLGGQEGDPAGIKIKASPMQALAERIHKETTRFVEEAGHHIGDADWDGVPETYLKALLDISERFADVDVAGDYAASNGVDFSEDLVAKIKALNELYASGRTTGHLIPDDEGQTVPMHDTAESLHNNGAFLPFLANSLATGLKEAGHHLEHGPGPHDSVVAADYDGKVKNTLNFLKAGVIADDPDDQDFRPFEHSSKAGGGKQRATKLFEPYHEVTAGKLNRGNAGAKIHPTVEEKNGVAVLGQANGFAHEAHEMSLTNGRPATHGGTGKDFLPWHREYMAEEVQTDMTNIAEGALNSFAASNDAEGVVQPNTQPSGSGSSATKYAMAGGVGAFVLLAGGLAFAFRPAGQKKRAPEQAAAVPEAPVVHIV